MPSSRKARTRKNVTASTVMPPDKKYERQTDFAGDGWRVFKIMAEFVNGFEKMSDTGPAVSVFGSTRVSPEQEEYLLAEKMGGLLAKKGFSVITGAGPGVMEAANKGAQQAGGISIGFNIELPLQQRPNPFIDRERLLVFQYFFVRKVMFLKYSQAYLLSFLEVSARWMSFLRRQRSFRHRKAVVFR